MKTSKDFALVQKNIFKDKRLSWQAKGFLAQALASEMNDDHMNNNKSIVDELEKYGYLITEKDENGDAVYNFFNDPTDHPEYQEMKKKSDKRKRKGADYKNILSNALGGITWSRKDFVVHHVNHNREDNNINNLLLLPRKLHAKYHFLLRHVQTSRYSLTSKSINPESVNTDMVFELVEVRKDIIDIFNLQNELVFALQCKDITVGYFEGKLVKALLSYNQKYN